MGSREMETLQARLDVLEVVVSELARAMAAERAATVSNSIRHRLNQLAAGRSLSPDVDEAISVSAAVVLTALGEHRVRPRSGQARMRRRLCR